MILSTQTFTHIPNNPIGVPVKRMLRPSIRTFFDHLLMTMHFAQGRPKPRVIPVRMKPMSFVKNSPYSAVCIAQTPPLWVELWAIGVVACTGSCEAIGAAATGISATADDGVSSAPSFGTHSDPSHFHLPSSLSCCIKSNQNLGYISFWGLYALLLEREGGGVQMINEVNSTA